MTRTHRFYAESRARARAPREPEARPDPSPYAGPTDAHDGAVQLAADPEFVRWVAEERAAEVAVLMNRAHRP